MTDNMTIQTEESAFQIPIEEKRIGFGKRLGSLLIDSLIVVIIGVILSLFLTPTLQDFAENQMREQMASKGVSVEQIPEIAMKWGVWGIIFGLTAGGAGFVLGLLELFIGMSLGKMMLGIQIAREDGKKGSMREWGIRWALKSFGSALRLVGMILAISILDTISFIVLAIYIVGCFFVLGLKKQAFHDTIAKTAVFDRNDITT